MIKDFEFEEREGGERMEVGVMVGLKICEEDTRKAWRARGLD